MGMLDKTGEVSELHAFLSQSGWVLLSSKDPAFLNSSCVFQSGTMYSDWSSWLPQCVRSCCAVLNFVLVYL